MKVWITCFLVLFGVAELLQWIRAFSLPLPVFIVAGAFLAVISNYDKLTHLPFHPDYEDPPQQDRPAADSRPATPVSPPKQPPTPTISFTIRKPVQPRE
jgi:hypothetical protein